MNGSQEGRERYLNRFRLENEQNIINSFLREKMVSGYGDSELAGFSAIMCAWGEKS